MFQRLYELSQCLPQRADWERLNEGMPANYDRGLALCFGANGEWVGVKTYKGNAEWCIALALQMALILRLAVN